METDFAPLDSSDLRSGSVDAAEYIVEQLAQLGVEYVFGVPGGAVEPLYNALARSERRAGPRAVVARHEAGAAFMADGYARATGRIGAVVATSGPGATNLITGVACASDNRVPMLVLTGQPRLPTFGRGALQESSCTGVDTVAMLSHCARYSSLVAHPEQLQAKLFAALMAAQGTPAGAAHLSIPVDVLRMPAAFTDNPAQAAPLLARTHGWQDDAAVNRLHDALTKAWRPVFVIGDGCAGAVPALMRLVDATGAEFVTTPDARGLVDPHHPACRGVFGFAGHERAAALLAGQPDLVVAFGTGFGEFASAGFAATLLNCRLVHVDPSELHLARTPMARMHVRGSIGAVCEGLLRRFGQPEIKLLRPRRADQTGPAVPALPADRSVTPVAPRALMQALAALCPPSTRYLADAGNSAAWAVHCLAPAERRQDGRRPLHERRREQDSWLRVTMDFAPMGWAIGAAVGVAAAHPGQPVVCLTGDGSWLMSGQEITVAAELGLPVVYVVLHDGALGMVAHGQRLAGAERIGTRLPAVDYAALARALGVAAHTVRSVDELAALDWTAIFGRNGPTLLDVHVDADAEPPMRMRLQALGTAR